jgi:hypothetical protein
MWGKPLSLNRKGHWKKMHTRTGVFGGPMVDTIAVAKSVIARRESAVLVPFCRVGMKGGPREADSLPRSKYCHDNVAEWVSRSPQHKHVRGYVIFDLRPLLVQRF